jgi:ubiquinone/menaquinone biosynthesis C-methylase UbiE
MQRDEYLKLAEVEDDMWYFRSLHGHARRELEARHAPGVPLKLLDAGCGTGGLMVRMRKARPAWTWSAIDFMPLACDLARERCPGCDIQQASVTALPFARRQFRCGRLGRRAESDSLSGRGDLGRRANWRGCSNRAGPW